MFFNRELITSVTAGTFLLSAATGLLLFFHVNGGAIKFVHEWLSWLFLLGVVCHVIVNFSVFKKYLFSKKGKVIVGLFAAILVVSALPVGKKQDPPFLSSIQALTQVPLTTLAQVAKTSSQDLMGRLSAAGLHPSSEQQTLNDLTGNNLRQQMKILSTVLGKPGEQP